MQTHYFLNNQGIEILHGDGHHGLAEFLEKQTFWIGQGSKWADKPSRYIEHYLLPVRGKGLWYWPNAGNTCERYYKQAVQYWRQGDLHMAMFYLGAASHLVQDLCVPYHAHGKVLGNHHKFERWARNNNNIFGICKGGIYEKNKKPFQWVYENACEAHPLYWCLRESYLDFFPLTVRKMLFLAQQTTAGFYYSFFHNVM